MTRALAVGACGMALLTLACSPAAPPRSAATDSTPTSALARGTSCVIDGTVTSADGAPIGAALVAAFVPYDSERAFVHTTASGEFCFEALLPGNYYLGVTSPLGAAAHVEPFATGEHGHGLDVRLGSAGFVVRGRVADEAGKAWAGAPVRLGRLNASDSGRGDLFLVQADAEGRFAARLPAGQYWVSIELEAASALVDDITLDRDVVVDVVTQAQNPLEQPPPDEVVAWVKERAVPLASVEPGSGFADLEPLRALIGSARLVGMGEATHGTHEFRALQQRVLEFLAEQMGFRGVIVEDTFDERLADDEYVRTATVEDPNRGPLLNWMRRHNQGKAKADQLRFLGNDLRRPALSVNRLAAAIRALDPKLWRELGPALEPLADDWSTLLEVQLNAPPPPGRERTEAATKQLVARLDERRAADVHALGVEGWALARVRAHVLADFVQLMKLKSLDERDRSMALNAVRLLEIGGPSAKMLLLAHNVHVQRVPSAMGQQGRLLSERLGSDYVALGSAFDHGSFNALGQQGPAVFTVGAAPPGSLDGVLARAGLPLLALDLRAAEGVARRWLHTPTYARSIGAVFEEARPFFDRSAPAERLDGVLFVATSTPLDPEEPRASSPPSPPPASPPSASPPSEAPPRDELPGALVNGDFEAGRVGEAPSGWQLESQPGSVVYRPRLISPAPEGKLALAIDREPSKSPVGYGSLSQLLDAKGWRGRRVRVSANVHLAARAMGDKAFVFGMAEDGMTLSHAISGQAVASRGWNVVKVEIDVPESARTLRLGVVVTGAARASVDEFSVRLVE